MKTQVFEVIYDKSKDLTKLPSGEEKLKNGYFKIKIAAKDLDDAFNRAVRFTNHYKWRLVQVAENGKALDLPHRQYHVG